ncbi:MAG: YbdD/YjiX family protein [Dokdonella sp.]|uniref:YbdD/YjiX family protein n=1 Tax=Dokdonella sp. TaxID=2291710 RepID=UPI003265F2D6
MRPVAVVECARSVWARSVRIARQIIGVPDYDNYLDHLRRFHPERALPTYAEFFDERQQARYKGGGGRCC